MRASRLGAGLMLGGSVALLFVNSANLILIRNMMITDAAIRAASRINNGCNPQDVETPVPVPSLMFNQKMKVSVVGQEPSAPGETITYEMQARVGNGKPWNFKYASWNCFAQPAPF